MKAVNTITTCDITGEQGAKPVTFAMDKVHYAIDLCDACHAKLSAIYAPYIEKGTRVKAERSTVNRPPKKSLSVREFVEQVAAEPVKAKRAPKNAKAEPIEE